MKSKKTKQPREASHPMWEEFNEFIANGIHFNTIPLDCGEPMTNKNRGEWYGYWHCYMQGIYLGRQQMSDTLGDTLRAKVVDKYGDATK